jgi:hypothetical protein
MRQFVVDPLPEDKYRVIEVDANGKEIKCVREYSHSLCALETGVARDRAQGYVDACNDFVAADEAANRGG